MDEHEFDAPGTKFRTTATVVAAGTSGIDSASGLIVDATTTTTDHLLAESKTERVLHTLPYNDTSNWCLGRPTDTGITKNHTMPNGGALTRSLDASWDGLNNSGAIPRCRNCISIRAKTCARFSFERRARTFFGDRWRG